MKRIFKYVSKFQTFKKKITMFEIILKSDFLYFRFFFNNQHVFLNV